MGLHTSDAIVLRCYPFRETSVTVSCLTSKYGKLKGLVKGLRAQPNRYRSAMEPMTINRIVFYDTRTSQLHLISQCDLLSGLPELQRDLETAKCAAFFVDLVDHVAPLEEPQPAIYELLRETLERLALGAGDMASIRVHFIVRLLRLTGFQPQVGECTGCGTAVHPMGYWSPKQGGFLCSKCLHEDPNAETAWPDLLDALETLAHSEHPITLEEKLLKRLHKRLNEFLLWRLDKSLRTLTATS